MIYGILNKKHKTEKKMHVKHLEAIPDLLAVHVQAARYGRRKLSCESPAQEIS